MEKKSAKKNNNTRQGNLGLQGGGSACAFTGGVIHHIITNPTVEFNRVTGTSGGALVGAALVQAINKFGYSVGGRTMARNRLVELWDDIAIPDSTAQMVRNIDNLAKLNIFLYPTFQSMLKGQFTRAMAAHLNRTTLNPNALQKTEHIELIINGVDANRRQKLFSGPELNAQSLMATGALPTCFQAITIDGVDYWDGALLGGANPPIEPLLTKKSDFLLFVMTHPPEHPITPRKQSDLTTMDVLGTDNIIIHQSYDEIALLLERQEAGDNIPPIHIIFPNELKKPWTSKDKQMIDQSIINERFDMGKRATSAFMHTNGSTLHKKSSITLKSLKLQARRTYQSLAIAA